jgi:hypothetical protein
MIERQSVKVFKKISLEVLTSLNKHFTIGASLLLVLNIKLAMTTILQEIIERIVDKKLRGYSQDDYIDFHCLTRTQKREILAAYMESTDAENWCDLIEGMSNTQKIACVMREYLTDRANEDLKRYLFKNKILEMLEIGMFDALADRVQPLIDLEVKKNFQGYADCMSDSDDYLFT